MFKVSLILPMYNEENSILNTLKQVTNYFDSMKYDYEIVVVDDKSNDNSLNLVKSINHQKLKLVCKPKNEGKGSAIKEGVKYATKDYIGFMDADLPYSLSNIEDMIKVLEHHHIAVGSRSVEGSQVEVHPIWYRILLSKIFCQIRNSLFNLNIKDTQSGLKFFRKKAIKDIFNKQKIKGFGFDTEILYLAKKNNYTIKEVPVHLLKEHSFMKSKLDPIKDSFKMFIDLVSIKLNSLLGKYK